jgi:hypothetical protein
MLTLLVLGSVGTVAATVLGNGNIFVAVAPIALMTAAACVWFLPIRLSMFALIFVGLAIDSSNEGPWNSPLGYVGMLLHVNLSKAIPGSGIPLPGEALALAVLLVIHAHRRMAGIRTDSHDRPPTARVMLQGLGVSLLAILGLCLLGLKNGGDMKMAKVQVQAYVLVLIFAYLCAISMRGLRDYRIIGGLIIATACIKAVIALYVAHIIVPTTSEYATAHGDSLLFACATVLLIVRLAEVPTRRSLAVCALLLPLLGAGMVANDRRLVWVQVLLAMLTYWLMSHRSPFKRLFVRGFLLALPVLLVYVAVGWSSQSKIFAPVQTLRSVGDSEVDASTLYRDLENYNLFATMRYNVLAGSGFGHPFVEEVKLPDISFFEEYRFMPHNSVLGLWAFCGPTGFTGITAALLVAVFLAARSYQGATVPDQRVAAVMTIAMIVIYMVHCWGDIGFSERRSVYLVGPALAMAGQLALSTGGWRIRPAKPRSVVTVQR